MCAAQIDRAKTVLTVWVTRENGPQAQKTLKLPVESAQGRWVASPTPVFRGSLLSDLQRL
jgi:hypothetical protein